MKKTLIYLMLAITLYSTTPLPAQAIFCSNCKNFVQGIFDAIKETLIGLETSLGTFNQTLDTVNNKVLKPMKDAMTIAQIAKNGQLVKTLITASTGGDPLLVSNPKLYLQNKGIAITQGGVDALAAQNGVYSNSVMKSIVAKAKVDNSSLATNLTAINQSSIPATQKAKICNDTALSEMARSQVAISGGDYNTVKATLNSSLCTGNPSTDPALAKRLIDVSNKNPSLDTFYAITSGDNEYTKSQLTQLEISKQAELAKTNATKDLASGGGIKSKTTCTKMASNGLCLEETIAQTGSVLNKAYNDALSSDLKTAISSIGSGAGSILGTFANAMGTIGLLNSLTSAAGSLGSSGGTGSGNNGVLGTVTIPNGGTVPVVTNTTTASSTGYAQDLKNNPQKKESIASAPRELLKQHQKMLEDMRKADNDFLSTINAYNSQLETVKSCYDGLLTTFPDKISASDSRIVNATSFYNQKKSNNTATFNKVTAELSKINKTSILITNTISIIDNSNSSDEISDTFKHYQDQIKNQDLPDVTAGSDSVVKQMEFAGELQMSTIEGGEIFNMNATCASIQQELNASNYSGSGM